MQEFRACVCVTLSILLSQAPSWAHGAELYAFGSNAGDQRLLRGDETAEEIETVSFPYYGAVKDILYVR